MPKLLMCFLVFFIACPSMAMEVAGVSIDETVAAADGTVLHLNGAGIRKKMWFKIYIAELYLQNPSSDAAQVIDDQGYKRVVMHFLYDKVEKEKLISAWSEGIHANTSAEELAALQSRVDRFNTFFDEDALKNDVVVLEYRPGEGTAVTIKGKFRGIIEGKDFNDALLSIWLGKKPVGTELRTAMLNKRS